MINTASETLISIPVDREHGGLRLSLVAVFVGIWIVAFLIANQLISSAGFNIIAGIIAFAASALGGRLIEPILKDRWPSGRTVQVDHQGVRLMRHGQIETEVRSNDAVSTLLWRFKVNRRGRVPKGWYVVACALEQDDFYLPIYTFASPEQAESLHKITRFTDLMNEKAVGNVKQDSLRVAGEQRRLRLAETHRWTFGAEMTFEDFEAYLRRLNGQFPQWLP